MRQSVIKWLKEKEAKYNLQGPILEVGSFIVSGHGHHADLRPLFPGREYLGTDMREGRGVDQVCNVEALPFKDDTFPSAISCDTFEHVKHPWVGIEEMRRVLKPGGILLFTVPFFFPIHDHPHDYWRYTPDGCRVLLENFSKVIVGQEPQGVKPGLVHAVAFK